MLSRQLLRWCLIQSTSAKLKPTSLPAFSDSLTVLKPKWVLASISALLLATATTFRFFNHHVVAVSARSR